MSTSLEDLQDAIMYLKAARAVVRDFRNKKRGTRSAVHLEDVEDGISNMVEVCQAEIQVIEKDKLAQWKAMQS
jgi:hypothetical protein